MLNFEKKLILKGFYSTLVTLRWWVKEANSRMGVIYAGIFKGYSLSPVQSSHSVSPAVGSSAQNFDAHLSDAALRPLSPHLLCKAENNNK